LPFSETSKTNLSKVVQFFSAPHYLFKAARVEFIIMLRINLISKFLIEATIHFQKKLYLLEIIK